jgi:hypothetical protein
MFDVGVTDEGFNYSQRMDPILGELYGQALQSETAKLKFGSDERINQANVDGAMARAQLEAELARERMVLEDKLAGEQDELARYNIEQQMSRLEYQGNEARFAQAERQKSEMEQLTFAQTAETERARIPWEYKRENRERFMPILERLLGGGGMGGGAPWGGGGFSGEVGPNIADNTPSFEGVLRRGVNDIMGNTLANRDAAMLGATSAQTGPEGGLGGGTTANYLGPLAQHSAATSMTGGMNELMQNLLQHNLGQRQATSQTLGALAPYLT